MARIGILTCSNCTQETNCASVVCLGDMRKRKGFFERYENEKNLDLIGIINCSGCPTLAAPEKILKKVKSIANYKIEALHFSFCITALCPFIKKYQKIIQNEFPDLKIVLGTHAPKDKKQFRNERTFVPHDSTNTRHEQYDYGHIKKIIKQTDTKIQIISLNQTHT